MADFAYEDLLPIGADETPYRLLTTEGVRAVDGPGRAHLPRGRRPRRCGCSPRPRCTTSRTTCAPAHLQQLRNILDDPEASNNDKFVALDLLKNANIAAGGVLPMCQDTGTAIVMGKRGQHVLTPGTRRGGDQPRGLRRLHAAQPALLADGADHDVGGEEHRLQPARPGRALRRHRRRATRRTYKFLFMAKGGGSANKSYLYQETKAILNEDAMMRFLDEKLRSLGTAACPPYHLAIVIGGTSAEFALKTAKYASAKYLDTAAQVGRPGHGHGFRDTELEEKVLELTRQFGIGAQFGGKYFCHDVRVVRLPRHGASLPVAIAVSCSADRQALGKITPEGVFIEQLETDPARFLPDAGARRPRRATRTTPSARQLDQQERRRQGRPQPADGRHPRRAVEAPGQDAALAHRPARRRPRHRARQDQGAARRRRGDAAVPQGPPGLLRRARPRPPQGCRPARSGRPPRGAWTPTSTSSRPPAARRSCSPRATAASRSPTRASAHGGFYLGSIGGPAARLAQDCIKHVEVLEYPELGMEAVWKIEVEDFPAFIVVDDKGNDFFAEVSKPMAFTIEKRTGARLSLTAPRW